MSNFGTMKARVAGEMKRGEITACATAVSRAVISSIVRWKNRRFPWNEFNGDLKNTVSSTTAVTLSTTANPNIIKLDSIRMVIGSRDYPLKAETWQFIDSVDAGQWYGYPEYYVIHSNEVRLYPPPNAVYPMRWAGVTDLTLTTASAESATNAWMTDGEELIRTMSKSLLFRDELRNRSQADYFLQQSHIRYKEIVKEITGKTSAGKVNPTRF